MITELNRISNRFREYLYYNNIRGYALSLDFSTVNKTIKTTAAFSQSDLNTAVISVELLNNAGPIILDPSSIVYVNIERPDGSYVVNECKIISAEYGLILISFNSSSLEVPGTIKFEVVVTHPDDMKIVSPKTSCKVAASIDSNKTQPSKEKVDLLDILITDIINMKKEIVEVSSATNQLNEQIIIDENSRKDSEEDREANENIRIESEKNRESSEQLRNNQELERQENFKKLSANFTNKIEEVNNKMEKLDVKLTEINTQEEDRKEQHLERIDEFDNSIKPYFQEVVLAENSRVDNELDRIQQESNRYQSELLREEFESNRQQQEENRKLQESKRVSSFTSIENTFNSKIETINSKVNIVDGKILEINNSLDQFNREENNRNQQHLERIQEFDLNIRPSHEEIVIAESIRTESEIDRNNAEEDRKAQELRRIESENLRVNLDLERERKVNILEQRVNDKIAEYNTTTLITNAEIDTIIANALK